MCDLRTTCGLVTVGNEVGETGCPVIEVGLVGGNETERVVLTTVHNAKAEVFHWLQILARVKRWAVQSNAHFLDLGVFFRMQRQMI